MSMCEKCSGTCGGKIGKDGVFLECCNDSDAAMGDSMKNTEIKDFSDGVEMMITHEESGGYGWWRGYEMLKAAYRKNGLKHSAPWFNCTHT